MNETLSDYSPEGHLATLKQQKHDYQRWTSNAGPHSTQGKFYRTQISEKTKQIKDIELFHIFQPAFLKELTEKLEGSNEGGDAVKNLIRHLEAAEPGKSISSVISAMYDFAEITRARPRKNSSG